VIPPGYHFLYVSAKRSEPRFLHAVTSNTFTVTRSRSHFNGRFQDRLVDEDGNDLIDHLKLGVGVTVTDSVKLSVMAYLSAVEHAVTDRRSQRCRRRASRSGSRRRPRLSSRRRRRGQSRARPGHAGLTRLS
jgi:hypothetical protein